MANMFQIKADIETSVLLLYLLAEQASNQINIIFLDQVVDDQRSLNMKPPTY
tara:strand:+ start:203 stop:358 length:156 start_codon:yes stop_codon:yes gene_type:complete